MLQREAMTAEDENEEEIRTQPLETLQRSAATFGQPRPPAGGERAIEELRQGGEALSPTARRQFESRFGFDFGRVRVHTGSKADLAAQAVHARAYTLGNNIVFSSGQGEILTTALLGRFGGPRHIIDDARRWTLNRGFLIEVGAEDGFKIGAGRYFVDGLLCENFAELAFLTQSDFPTTDDDDLPDPPFLVHLEVFERPLAAIQDEAIVEPALEGLDTAARSRLIWQVKVLVPPAGLAVPTAPIDDLAWNTWLDILDPPGRGILRARTNSDVVNDGNPCIVPITSAFRGEDNQLYRVEVHDGGDLDDATFTWSRENASVLFPIEKLDGTTVTVTTLGRDRRSGLKPGDWVEVIDDHRELRRDDVVPLFQVENILRDQRLVVLKAQDDVPLPDYNADDPRRPDGPADRHRARRWGARDPRRAQCRSRRGPGRRHLVVGVRSDHRRYLGW